MNAKKNNNKKAPKKKANGYQMAEPFKKGEVLTDTKKNQWVIGNSIGIGGFGEIYEAATNSSQAPKSYPAVVKIEPRENGPLFVEMHFYVRAASPEEIDTWRKKKKLLHLGMPKFLGSGSHEYNSSKYRFLVVERYGTDLWKLFNENGRSFPEHTVYNVALQVIDVLEYIHSKTYIHGDIKGGNLLLDPNSTKHVFLVDFGLACHYTTKDEYKPDPRKAHDGTPEYTSRDAHNGVPTMRGDMEILGYNMIQWLCGSLPWENDLTDPKKTQKRKEEAFANLDAFLSTCFDDDVPEPISRYMKLLSKLDFSEAPDYDKFREIIVNGLTRLKKKPYDKLEFSGPAKSKPSSKKANNVPEKVAKVELVRVPKGKAESQLPKGKVGALKKQAVNLDESTDTILDKKFETGAAAINHLLDSVDFDSESEYDIQITKRKKKGEKPEEAENSPAKKRGTRKKKLEEDSDAEEKVTPVRRGRNKVKVETPVKTTPQRRVKAKPKYTEDSDEDMFE